MCSKEKNMKGVDDEQSTSTKSGPNKVKPLEDRSKLAKVERQREVWESHVIRVS